MDYSWESDERLWHRNYSYEHEESVTLVFFWKQNSFKIPDRVFLHFIRLESGGLTFGLHVRLAYMHLSSLGVTL